MSLTERIKRMARIIRVTVIRKIIHLTRRIVLPGFEGVSVWEIIFFFFWSIRKGLITTRAAALSFHFFLALIPFGLILVIVSSQLPFFDLEKDIAPLLTAFIPDQLVYSFLDNMTDYENSSVSSLISVGFLVAFYFTSNGFVMLIRTFSSSRSKAVKKRKWWSMRLVAVGYVCIFLLGFFVLFFIELLLKKGLNFWADHSEFIASHHGKIFGISSFMVIALIMYLGVAMIFYFIPSNRKEFRFFSAGATLSTFMIIIISLGYSYYVTAFAKYNDLYGSLGTIMIQLLWIYLNTMALLIGFELNASIHGAVKAKRLDRLEEIEQRQDKNY